MRTRTYRLLASGIVAVTPVLVTCLLVRIYFGATLFDFFPFYNDEIAYWHQSLTFSQVGFNGGYFTIDELPAQATFMRFGPHGPVFPIIYGFLGGLVGWGPSTGVLLNIVAITLALGTFMFLSKPDTWQSLTIFFLVLTFQPLLLLLPTNMQESFHQSLGIVFAGLFYRLVQPKSEGGLVRIALFATIVIAALARFTWSILFIPFFFLSVKDRSRFSRTWIIGLSIFLMILSVLVFRFLASPYPNDSISDIGKVFFYSPWRGVGLLASATISGLGILWPFGGITSSVVEQLLRYQVIFLVALGLIGQLLFLLNKETVRNVPNEVPPWFHIINLGVILGLILPFYMGSWRDYRVLAPHFLLSILLVALSSKRRVAQLAVLASLVFVQPFMSIYNEFRTPNFVDARSEIASFEEQTGKALVYEATSNAWCNSVAVDVGLYETPLMGVPGGMGISAILDWDRVRLPLKSKYVLGKSDLLQEVTQPSRGSAMHLEPLVETSIGVVYLNLDSQCGR